MQLRKTQRNIKQTFKSLYVGQKLTNKILYSPTSTKFISDFSAIKNNIFTNKLDRKQFVDILLHNDNEKFYAVISSKKQGTPHNPHAKQFIELTKKGFAKFKNWVNEWNHQYNPQTIKESKKLNELIRNTNWENTPLDKALKAIQ